MAVSTMQDDKKKALNLAIAQIEKSCGKGSIMRMGADAAGCGSRRSRPARSTSMRRSASAAFRAAASPRSTVRSRAARPRSVCTSSPTRRRRAASPPTSTPSMRSTPSTPGSWASTSRTCSISQPDTGEQALEICEILVRSGAVDVVVIDSVAALVPKAEIEGDMGDSHMGLQARLMSQALRKLTGAIARSKTSVVFINQLREKIGVMFGNPETTTGGKALKFYASVRLDIRRIGPVKEKEDVIGSHVRVKVVKNKVAPPFKQAEFDIMYAEGISHASLVLDIAAEVGHHRQVGRVVQLQRPADRAGPREREDVS